MTIRRALLLRVIFGTAGLDAVARAVVPKEKPLSNRPILMARIGFPPTRGR